MSNPAKSFDKSRNLHNYFNEATKIIFRSIFRLNF